MAEELSYEFIICYPEIDEDVTKFRSRHSFGSGNGKFKYRIYVRENVVPLKVFDFLHQRLLSYPYREGSDTVVDTFIDHAKLLLLAFYNMTNLGVDLDSNFIPCLSKDITTVSDEILQGPNSTNIGRHVLTKCLFNISPYQPPLGKEDDGKEKCGFCLLDLNDGTAVESLPCTHSFHQHCISRRMRVVQMCLSCQFASIRKAQLKLHDA